MKTSTREIERERESRIKGNPTGGFVWSEIKVGPSDGGGGGRVAKYQTK